jgi:hypothetical protein
VIPTTIAKPVVPMVRLMLAPRFRATVVPKQLQRNLLDILVPPQYLLRQIVTLIKAIGLNKGIATISSRLE